MVKNSRKPSQTPLYREYAVKPFREYATFILIPEKFP